MEKDQEYLEKLFPRIKTLGFDDFDSYISSRLSLSLKEVAEELGESYFVFQKFHYRYIKGVRGDGRSRSS